jgi:hypothetical protein
MICQFLHVVVHRSNVTAEQLIDASVRLILKN